MQQIIIKKIPYIVYISNRLFLQEYDLSKISFKLIALQSPRLSLTTSKWNTIIRSMSHNTKALPKVSLADLPDLITIREVASLLRVSSLTIKRWGKKGKLPAIRINTRGDRRYKKTVVLKLLGEVQEE
jgi:excisionase family DNA binding protein